MTYFVERHGDLFTSKAAAIGHGVNCKGLMGAGIAKEFRRRWPEMYSEYRKMCDEEILKPGGIYPFRVVHVDQWFDSPPPFYVLNIASQQWPGPDASYEWLEAGVSAALEFCRERGVASLAVPRIGCGIGGLEWDKAADVFSDAAGPYQNVVTLEVWTQ